jgi:hypothetical protein
MAEYSLEYGMGWYDFSIRKVSETLEPGMYVPCICEGFGFVAIAKDLKGNIGLIWDLPEEPNNFLFADFELNSNNLKADNPVLIDYFQRHNIPYSKVDQIKLEI